MIGGCRLQAEEHADCHRVHNTSPISQQFSPSVKPTLLENLTTVPHMAHCYGHRLCQPRCYVCIPCCDAVLLHMLQAAGSPTTWPTTTTQGDRFGISSCSCWVTLPSVHTQLACEGKPASLITHTCTQPIHHTGTLAGDERESMTACTIGSDRATHW